MMGWLHPWGRDRLGSAGVAEELPSRSGVPEPPGWNVDGPSSKFITTVVSQAVAARVSAVPTGNSQSKSSSS